MGEKAKFRIVGQLCSDGNVVGYCVLNLDSGESALLSGNDVINMAKDGKLVNAEITNGELKGTEGSLKRIPLFNEKGEVEGESRVTIIYALYRNDRPVGYELLDAYGRRDRFSKSDALDIVDKYGATNAKVVRKGGESYLWAIKGTFEKLDIDNKPIKGPEIWERPIDQARYVRNLTIFKYDDVTEYLTNGVYTINMNRSGYRFLGKQVDLLNSTVSMAKNRSIRSRTKKHYFNTVKAVEKGETKDKITTGFLKDLALYGLINRVNDDLIDIELKEFALETLKSIKKSDNKAKIVLACVISDFTMAYSRLKRNGGNMEDIFLVTNIVGVLMRMLKDDISEFDEDNYLYGNIDRYIKANVKDWYIKDFKSGKEVVSNLNSEVTNESKKIGVKVVDGELIYFNNNIVHLVSKKINYFEKTVDTVGLLRSNTINNVIIEVDNGENIKILTGEVYQLVNRNSSKDYDKLDKIKITNEIIIVARNEHDIDIVYHGNINDIKEGMRFNRDKISSRLNVMIRNNRSGEQDYIHGGIDNIFISKYRNVIRRPYNIGL